MEWLNKIHAGNALFILGKMPAGSVDCVITSPPYWALRDYGTNPQVWGGDENCVHEWYKKKDNNNFCAKCFAWLGELGLEPDFNLYIQHLLSIFDQIKRVLKSSGSVFVNLGDTYSGSTNGGNDYRTELSRSIDGVGKRKNSAYKFCGLASKIRTVPKKSLIGIPERFALGMTERQWIRRNTIIWWKPNCLPQSVKDRFTVDFEYVYFFVKSSQYFFEQQLGPLVLDIIPRMLKGYNEETPQKISQPRSNIRKMTHTNYGGDGKGLHGHSGYFDKDGKPRFYFSGRNMRTVWRIPTYPFPESHFATFPEKLIETMIKAGCPEFICKKCGKAKEKIIEATGGNIGKSWHDHSDTYKKGMAGRGGKPKGSEPYRRYEKGYFCCQCEDDFYPGVVLDPFCGSGTTCLVAKKLNRNYIGIDLRQEYVDISNRRIETECGTLI